jgi:hypothetical protein
MRALLPILALSLMTGCIASLADLDGDAPPTDAAGDALTPASDDADAAAPLANLTKPPVARIQVFGASNALIYKADFKADNVTTPLAVPAGVELTFLSSESAPVEPGAKLARAVWTVNGKTLEATKANVTLPGPGLYPLTLTVTDSNGATDAQALALGVYPEPFDVTTNLTTGQMVGAEGQGQAARLAFSLTTDAAGVPATIQSVKLLAGPPLTCDVTLALLDAEGAPLAEANDADATTGDQAEALDAGALPEGGYAVLLTPNACLAPEGFPVQVTVTYLETIPGLTDAGGDGHGGHAH